MALIAALALVAMPTSASAQNCRSSPHVVNDWHRYPDAGYLSWNSFSKARRKAIDNWESTVKSQLGRLYARYSRARGKSETSRVQGGKWVVRIEAIPCINH